MIRSLIGSLCFLADNLKSKTCTERSRSIGNLKWGIVVAAAVLAAAAARAGEAPSWQSEWEKTLAAAKKEGEISFYGSEGYEKVFEIFQKKYPDIKVKSNTNRRGSEHGQAVMTERRAGQYLVDLFINGVVTPNTIFYKANILEPVRPQLILPEVLDESKWWGGKHHYADPDGKYIFVFQGSVHGGENA
jgi:ABC-type glycerol-3-phosphate transport system substrate-binding protein